MTTTELVLYRWKQYRNGEFPLMIRITKFRDSSYVSLGKTCPLEYWDFEKNRLSKRHPNFKELSALIDNRMKLLEKALTIFETETPNISAQEIQKRYKHEQKQNVSSVLDFIDQIVSRMITAGRIGYADVFRNTKNSLKMFLGGKDLLFCDLTQATIYRYENFIVDRGVKPNTVFLYLRTFKTILNYAKNLQVIKQDVNPFKDFSLSKYRHIKTKKRSISKEDIKKIQELTIANPSRLLDSRNIFLFSFFCRGINFIDIAHLRWSDIQENRLIYQRKKTKDLFNIKLLPPALEIINHYREISLKTGSNYIFPILDERKHKTPISIDNRTHKVLRQTNEDLKKIGEQLSITVPLTTYVARHSYANTLKQEGISAAIIREQLGHVEEKTTQIYLDTLGNNLLDDIDYKILMH